jgi:hypothetical protein
MQDDDDLNDDDLNDDEKVRQLVIQAVNDLLNIAAGVAELQTTDEGAEDIYTTCDLVAAYFGIEQAELETIENADGSYTTRVKNSEKLETRTTAIPGFVRTAGRPKLRLTGDKPLPPLSDDDQDL